MNRTAFLQFSEKSFDLLRQWKKDNWHRPIDVDKDNFVDFIKTNGGDEVMNLYNEIWDDCPDDDSEVQQALKELESSLYELNQIED